MSEMLGMTLAVTVNQLPGIIIRYLPFGNLITKEKRKRLTICYGVFLCLFFVFFFVTGIRFGVTIRFYKWWQLAGGMASTIINMLVIRNRVREHLFTSSFSGVWILLMFTIAIYLQHRLIQVDVTTQITINAWCLTGALFAFYPVIRMQMIRTVTPFLMLESSRNWNNIWCIPYAMFLSCYVAVPQTEYPTSIGIVISRTFMNIAILFVCRSMADDYKNLTEKQRVNAQLNRQKEYYEALSNRVLEARKVRHDFKHHIVAIKGFAEKEETQKIREYCDELLVNQHEQQPIPYSGNAAVDGVVYHYMQMAQKRKIGFETKGNFALVKIKDIDLCVLLGNVLDNAITACENVVEQSYITLSVKIEGNIVAIMVTNSFDGIVKTEENKILSRKREHEEGVGLTSVRDICQKYGGTMKIQYQDQTFTSLCLLDMGAK